MPRAGGQQPMARAYHLISADSHILEPPHLWTQYMPRKFHDKAPRVVPDGEGGEAWQFGPDTPPAPIGIYASAGRKHADVRWTGVTFAEANQGNFRAEPRLAEQDVDGVNAEVLFGSARMMSHFFSDPDPEFQLAGVQAYNNWIAEEFVKVAPDRLIGLACMPALGVEESIREMERCLRLGVRGVDLTGLATVGARDMIVDMAEIIQSGVHDRFPTLVWVAVETGCGWIPYLLEQLDDRWWRNRSWLPVKLQHEPSFYFRRNWRAAFMIDRYAVMNRHVIGVENMLWSTDYPHHGCDWPETRRVVDDIFRDVPAAERKRMCTQNAAELYKLT